MQICGFRPSRKQRQQHLLLHSKVRLLQLFGPGKSWAARETERAPLCRTARDTARETAKDTPNWLLDVPCATVSYHHVISQIWHDSSTLNFVNIRNTLRSRLVSAPVLKICTQTVGKHSGEGLAKR
jgi:hypothetical protein